MTLSKQNYVVQLTIKGESCPQFKVYDTDNNVVKQSYCPDIESECTTYDDVYEYIKAQFFHDWTYHDFNLYVELEIY